MRLLTVAAFCLRQLALLRHLGLFLPFALRAIRTGLLLLRALVAPLLLIAPLLIASTATAAIAPAFAATTVALVIAPTVTATTSATSAAALFVAITMLVAAALGALGARRAHRGFVGRGRLFRRFFGLQPAEQAAKEA